MTLYDDWEKFWNYQKILSSSSQSHHIGKNSSFLLNNSNSLNNYSKVNMDSKINKPPGEG